ncbi:unnamed protein product [Lactuca saligna]|uniref:Uncharacterized protein n=1 Tax=Lactuca saligna TaxID=75948 RepID=A0AA35VHS0_LACSI|nr:unnamed protein product [Lactuca saligna]
MLSGLYVLTSGNHQGIYVNRERRILCHVAYTFPFKGWRRLLPAAYLNFLQYDNRAWWNCWRDAPLSHRLGCFCYESTSRTVPVRKSLSISTPPRGNDTLAPATTTTKKLGQNSISRTEITGKSVVDDNYSEIRGKQVDRIEARPENFGEICGQMDKPRDEGNHHRF